LGIATQRVTERVLASLGFLPEAALRFERCDDVPQGGVLCALPALLLVGLLREVRAVFTWPNGYYPLETVFLSLSFLALARVSSLEALRYEPPGEWGKLLGLDRIPEVKTMREKVEVLCGQEGKVADWSRRLAQEWMQELGTDAGFYYIDGHVRVYHGTAAHRPKTYVAREQLCLRATLDYWVNAMDGRPFFLVTQELNQRLIETLREQIVPRLKSDVPHQPTPEQLAAQRRLHRFIVVFDREGYSPDYFAELWADRIAVITYARSCKSTEAWPAEEFAPCEVRLVNGQTVSMRLAERGVRLSNQFWIRELRHLDEKGQQVRILSTDWIDSLEVVVAAMYARWCQENFFRYMREHYSLDRLVQYGAEPIPDTAEVVNPARRALESEIRRTRTTLNRHRALLAAGHFPRDLSPPQAATFEQKQGQLLEAIERLCAELDQQKARRQQTPWHVPMNTLPAEQRFTRLRTEAKHFLDAIKMVAYRAETALVGLARQNLSRSEDARSWIQQVLRSAVNLIPNPAQQVLTVQIHPLSSAVHNEVLRKLCEHLTDTETVFPGTNLRLVYEFPGPR
jgi:hypothetical protein